MRIKIRDSFKKEPIKDPKKIADILVKVLKVEDKSDRMKEHFWGIYLNARNIISRIELIHLGTLNASLVHPRDVFRPAIVSSVASIIVLHNHPSDDVEPSEDDLDVTRRIVEAGKIMGIDVLDHLIINEKGKHFSFKAENLIKD